MARKSACHASQAKRPQSRRASGSAVTKPRAKLRFRPDSIASGSCGSVMAITLSIVLSDLLLLGRLGQTIVAFFRKIHPKPPRRTAPHLGPSVLADIRDMAAVIRLAFSNDPSRHAEIERVIRLGPGRKRRRHLVVARRLAIFLACLVAPRVALAQEAPKVITPIDLFDGETSPGIRIAPSLILKGEAAAQIQYDTNIYNVDTPKRSDTAGILKPGFKLVTDLPRHGAEVVGKAEVRRYFKTEDENSEQYELVGRGFLELGDRMAVSGEAGIARKIEMRGTAGDQFDTDRPVHYTERRVAAQASRTGGKLELSIGGAITKLKFSDPTSGGVPLDLSFRDAVIRLGKVRADFNLNPRVAVYTELSVNEVDYTQNDSPSRDSNGYSLLGGIHFQVSALVDVQGAIGFIRQNFDDPQTKTAKGIDYELKVNWTPTPRWKLTASAARVVDPSPLSNVPAIVRSNFELKVQRAVSDRILLEVGVAHVHEDYRMNFRADKRYLAFGAVRYRLAQHVELGVQAGYRKQDSGGFGREYNGASIGLSLGVTL